MSGLFWLTDDRTERLRPFFRGSPRRPRVDDRRVRRDVIFVNRDGLHWRYAPKDYDPAET